jgi:hypothetical protein
MTNVNFRTLAQLLETGHSTGVLATAIEKHGVYGWDRYGRFRHFKPSDQPSGASGEDYVGQALDCLAYIAERDEIPEAHPELTAAQSGRARPWFNCGWPEDELPDLDSIEAQQPVAPPRPSSLAKKENSTLMVVAALLAFTKGELGVAQHPEYSSERQLIGLLADKMRGYPGMGRRNFQTKFADAKKLMKRHDGS